MNMLQQTPGHRAVDPTADAALLAQVAALCTREGNKGLRVLLVQSSAGRWILPKGWPMDDRSDAEAAKLEAWEEAGVAKGTLGKAPIGRFMTQKRFEDGRVAPCLVAVYPIKVKTMTKTYPEAGLRRRKWFSLKKAIKKVDDPGLRQLLRSLVSAETVEDKAVKP